MIDAMKIPNKKIDIKIIIAHKGKYSISLKDLEILE